MTAALNIADYALTREALRYGGVAEGNPMMKNIVKNTYIFAAVKRGPHLLILNYWRNFLFLPI
jgi:hypothetical protein